MAIMIKGHFSLPTNPNDGHPVTVALNAIEAAIRTEQSGSVARTANSIKFSRGYSLGYGKKSRLAIFDPGLFEVFAEGRALRIRYSFTISYIYWSLPILFLVVACLFFLSPNRREGIGWGAFIMFFAVANFVIAIARAHFWMKSRIAGALSKYTEKKYD